MPAPNRVLHDESSESGPVSAPRTLAYENQGSLTIEETRLHHAERLEAGPLGDERGLAAGRRLEGEEADLVLGNVDGPTEADARPLKPPCFSCRTRPPFLRLTLAGGVARKESLDKVFRHARDDG